MKDIIELNPTAQTYYDMAEEKLKQDDFAGAAYYFYRSVTSGGGPDALLALGETYCDMGEYEEGLKYLYLALDKRPSDIDICHSISQCFMDMDDEDTAFFYFQPGMSIDGFREMLNDTDSLVENPKPAIRVLEKNDEMVLNIAIKLFDSGDLTYGRELLLTVRPESDYYVSANNLLALSSLELKNPQQALDFANKALQKSDNIDSRCNIMLAHHMLENADEVAKISSYIESQKVSLGGHKTASLAYIRMDDAKRAAYHLKAILDVEKNNREALVSYALAKHALNDKDEAKQLIVRASMLYPADITIPQLALCIAKGEKLGLFPLLSDQMADIWLDELDKKLGYDYKKGKTLYTDESFTQKIKWLFQTTMSIRQGKAVMSLGRFKEWHGFIKELLLDNEIELTVKRLCLISLLIFKQKGEVGIVIEGLYSRLKFKYPANLDNLFHRAYSIAFASFAFSDSRFEDRICATTRRLLQIYYVADNAAEVINDENALAAAIFFATRHDKIDGIEHCCHLFGCNKEELVKHLEFFGIKSAEKGKKSKKQSKI